MRITFPRIAILTGSIVAVAAAGGFAANMLTMLSWVVGAVAPRDTEHELRETLLGKKGDELASAFRVVIQRAPNAPPTGKESVRIPAQDPSVEPSPLHEEQTPENSAKESREELISILHSGSQAFDGAPEESIATREKLLDLALRVTEGPIQEYNQDAISAASLILNTASPEVGEDLDLKQRRDQVMLRSQSVILSMGEDPQLAYDVTVQALNHERDPAMREIFRGQLEAQFPQFAPSLTQLLGPPIASPAEPPQRNQLRQDKNVD